MYRNTIIRDRGIQFKSGSPTTTGRSIRGMHSVIKTASSTKKGSDMAQLEQEFAIIRQKIEAEMQTDDVSHAAGVRIDELLDRLELLTRLLHHKHVEHIGVRKV